jgi:hypothetical protein
MSTFEDSTCDALEEVERLSSSGGLCENVGEENISLFLCVKDNESPVMFVPSPGVFPSIPFYNCGEVLKDPLDPLDLYRYGGTASSTSSSNSSLSTIDPEEDPRAVPVSVNFTKLEIALPRCFLYVLKIQCPREPMVPRHVFVYGMTRIFCCLASLLKCISGFPLDVSFLPCICRGGAVTSLNMLENDMSNVDGNVNGCNVKDVNGSGFSSGRVTCVRVCSRHSGVLICPTLDHLVTSNLSSVSSSSSSSSVSSHGRGNVGWTCGSSMLCRVPGDGFNNYAIAAYVTNVNVGNGVLRHVYHDECVLRGCYGMSSYNHLPNDVPPSTFGTSLVSSDMGGYERVWYSSDNPLNPSFLPTKWWL